MAYEKGKVPSGGKKGMMTEVKGMCSYSKNPVKPASMTESKFGPGMNKDQQKANKLLKEAHKSESSLRGVGVM